MTNKKDYRVDLKQSLILLIILQVLDGILTYIGVSIHGNSAEANPILRYLFETFTVLPSLIVVKGFCCFLLISAIRWLKSFKERISLDALLAVKLINLLYLLAVVGWLIILGY